VGAKSLGPAERITIDSWISTSTLVVLFSSKSLWHFETTATPSPPEKVPGNAPIQRTTGAEDTPEYPIRTTSVLVHFTSTESRRVWTLNAKLSSQTPLIMWSPTLRSSFDFQ